MSGGEGVAGGGAGGEIDITAFDGGLVTPTSTRAQIYDNYLTAEVLADNLVTLDELGYNSELVFFEGTTGYLELTGYDFYVPAGVMIDLGEPDFGLDSIQLRVTGDDDFIRIDGDIVGTRAGGDGVSLSLVSTGAEGPAITIDGAVDLSGASGAVAFDGGTFTANSSNGTVVVAGTVTTTGGVNSVGAGGVGGDIILRGANGDVELRAGIFQSNGGAGSGAGNGLDDDGNGIIDDEEGNGGGAGTITIASTKVLETSFEWGLRCDGGASTGGNGGAGGAVDVHHSGSLNLSLAYSCSGGDSTTANGGSSGRIDLTAGAMRGSIAGVSDGGDGNINGGNGGELEIEGNYLWGLLLQTSANGGNGATGNGGAAGSSWVISEGLVANVRWLADLVGGTGVFNGGWGGAIRVRTWGGDLANVTVVTDLSGGVAAAGNGGAGGIAGILINDDYGGAVRDTSLDITASGGAGVVGGVGGQVLVDLSGGADNTIDVTALLDGGSGTGDGGAGGKIRLDAAGLSSNVITVAGSARGGTTATAIGGRGGDMELYAADPLWVSAPDILDLGGGAATGAGGVGGSGGRVVVNVSRGIFAADDLNVVARGGDSAQAHGGAGGSLSVSSSGNAVLDQGTLDFTGGEGSTASGTGIGGAGGTARIESQYTNVYFDMTLLCNGGDGRGGGGDASRDEGVHFSAAHWMFGAGFMRIDGTIEVMGGAGNDGSSGGAGGYLSIDTQGDDADITTVGDETHGDDGPGGDVEWLAAADVSGGNSILDSLLTADAGGDSGVFELTTQGASLSVQGRISANGGEGNPGGGGGELWLNEGDNPAAVITLAGGLLLEARGGDGIVVPAMGVLDGGDGGDIFIAVGPVAWVNDVSSTTDVSGGDSDGLPGTVTHGWQSCVPAITCEVAGAACGEIDDGCGTPIDCGACTVPGETCGGGVIANQCGVASGPPPAL